MAERSYAVREIDDLRQCCETKYLYGYYQHPMSDGIQSFQSRSYFENEKVKTVEEWVRTHMLAGHTAADLIASEQGASHED